MISIDALNKFNEDREAADNEVALNDLGGMDALEKLLGTSFSRGLSTDKEDFENRIKLYGENKFPSPPAQTWLSMFFESFEDTTIIVLIVAAAVSLVVGLYEDPAKGWLEGAAILSSVLLVAVVTATNNYSKEQQFRSLNAVKDDSSIGILRDGTNGQIRVQELLVGDIVILNTGDKIPADGLLINGSDIMCNESALTGESEDKEKSTRPAANGGDRFLLSGTSLCSGFGSMLVTSVGSTSRWGKTKAKLAGCSPDTPLQEKLEVLAGQIGNIGFGAAVATFIAMLAIWFKFPETRRPGVTLFDYVLEAFIMGVTIVVVAVPEGLPLAVTLSLAYSTKKMAKDNNLIRVLAACETIGNATNICSDKTGTLTENRMTVVAAFFGNKFFSDISEVGQSTPPKLVEYLKEGISVNTTASLTENHALMEAALNNGTPIPESAVSVNGSKTEGALLIFLKKSFGEDYKILRHKLFDDKRGDRLFTFTSDRKRMTVLLVTNPSTKEGIAYTKGASEVVLGLCNKYVDKTGTAVPISPSLRREIQDIITNMAKDALRTIALAHKNVSNIGSDITVDDIENDLVLDGIVGIKDPLRPEVKQAVEECQAAGIFVRMVTGDNIDTASAIAKECGILTHGGICMEGPKFRALTPAQLDEILPTLQVLARSSPEDKYILVTRLNGKDLPKTKEEWEGKHPGLDWETKRDEVLPGYQEEWEKHPGREMFGGVGEVVGATGDGTNDAPALKAADVGLSMGLSGTDVAKDASDIVILDDNFSSIVKAVTWGRSVFDNIRKFLQFQLTVNLVALSLTFISAVRGQSPPLNAVMMLWVNLIMDTMGALALGTEPPSPSLLLRRPYKRNASLISNTMIRNIMFQWAFQMILLSYLSSYAISDFNVVTNVQKPFWVTVFERLLGVKQYDSPNSSALVGIQTTIVFNTFVFCQIFNEINSRSISDEMNVFDNLHSNFIFIFIIVTTFLVQFIIVQYGGDFVKTTPLSVEQWVKCILLGSLTLPLGGIMRLIPFRDSENDFAVLPEILVQKSADAKEKLMKNKNFISKDSEENSKTSFHVWIFVVMVIPVITLSVFSEHWSPRFTEVLTTIVNIAQGTSPTRKP